MRLLTVLYVIHGWRSPQSEPTMSGDVFVLLATTPLISQHHSFILYHLPSLRGLCKPGLSPLAFLAATLTTKTLQAGLFLRDSSIGFKLLVFRSLAFTWPYHGSRSLTDFMHQLYASISELDNLYLPLYSVIPPTVATSNFSTSNASA